MIILIKWKPKDSDEPHTANSGIAFVYLWVRQFILIVYVSGSG